MLCYFLFLPPRTYILVGFFSTPQRTQLEPHQSTVFESLKFTWKFLLISGIYTGVLNSNFSDLCLFCTSTDIQLILAPLNIPEGSTFTSKN